MILFDISAGTQMPEGFILLNISSRDYGNLQAKNIAWKKCDI